ncbi:MAG: HipA domain-containing protein [Bdellovibrionota bacterium]
MSKHSSHKCRVCCESTRLAIDSNYHEKCVEKLFGTVAVPEIDFTMENMEELAKQEINQRVVITGVQPKLSMDFESLEGKNKNNRLTVVGLWGRFILKPPHKDYPQMPALEHITMRMAQMMGIQTAENGLIQFESGELAYVARRFDRPDKNSKLAQEDFCQLSQQLTEHKYRGSMEKAGNIISEYSSNPGFDLIRFCELALFSFLTGNADMHLKNFSLLTNTQGLTVLSPGYDLISTALIIPQDKEEMALTINGKKSKLVKNDFDMLFQYFELPEKAIHNLYARMEKEIPKWIQLIKKSFLSKQMQEQYIHIIHTRAKRIFF